MLGVRGNSEAMGLKKILSGDSESARSVRLGLERRGTDLAAARAISLFGGDSRTGDAAEFVVSRDGLLIVAAAGAAMEAGAQDTVTPIRVHIFRSRLRAPNETPLPDPLADPAQDIRVHRATAKAYFARAANIFRSSMSTGASAPISSAKGLEHPLDVTATRSLVGQNYPLPGPFFQGLRPGYSAAGGSGPRRSGGTMPSISLVTRAITPTRVIPATSTARTTLGLLRALPGIALVYEW